MGHFFIYKIEINKMKINNIDSDDLIDLINEHQWIKYLLYSGGAIVSIWILGKASKLVTDAILNFKSLHHAIKQ